MPTRRQFLRNCSLAAATASLVPVSLLAQSPAAKSSRLISPGLEQFKSHLNTSFAVQAGGQVVSLVLVEAKALPAVKSNAQDARNEKFSLLFRGPLTLALGQETHPFEHPQLGGLPIFIVPIGCRDTTHKYYEAIFNRPMHPVDLAAQLAAAPKRGQMS